MPGIDHEFLTNLKEDFKEYPVFVETGTCDGHTIMGVEQHFTKLYTIEFSEMYYTRTKKRYNGDKIDFIQGDSSFVFKHLLPTLHEKCIFFLDGHWSSGDTGRSAKDCPLVEEITHINALFKQAAIIIIDDVRLFGTKRNEDWSEISREGLLDIIKDRTTMVYSMDSVCARDDRLIIHIRAK